MLDTRSALANDSSFPGIAVLKPTSGKHMYQPTKGHETIMRVYPAPASDGSGFLSYRKSSDDNDFTDWLAVDYVARFVGSEQRITFITRCVNQDPNTSEMLWDRLVRTVIRGIDDGSHPEWVYLIRGKSGQGAAIPGQTIRQAKAKIHGFVQGILLKHKGTNFRNQPKTNVVLMLPPTARVSLQTLCNEENKAWDGIDPEDYAKRFTCGEWLAPQSGRELIVEFRKDENDSGDEESGGINLANIGGGTSVKAASGGGAKPFANAYDVRLSEKITPIPGDVINRYFKPWDQVLRYLNEQEQVELMCSAFKHDVVKAAFGGLNLLPRSIEFGQTISVPSQTATRRQTQAAPAQVTQPVVSNTVAVPAESINLANLDEGGPGPEVTDDTPPFDTGAPAADPGQTADAEARMAAALAEARKSIKR